MNLSDVMLDNDNKRIDSEYFRKQYLKFFKEVPNLKPLGEFVQEGYRVVYENTKIIDKQEAEKGGYPYFLQATDLDTPFINTSNLFHVSNDEWIRYPKGRIKKGEILIEVKGKIDKVSIVPEDFPERTLVTGSLFKLSVNGDISKHVLLCYLICKYGVAFKDRFKTNLLISYISKPDLYRIPVPNFSASFQQKIDEIFKVIFKSKEKASKIYQQAETVLLQEIGLQDFKANTEAVNVKSFSESFAISGRLDAEYYQKKYDDYIRLVKSYSKGFDGLSEVCNLKGANYKPEDESLYKYIELSNIGVTGDVTGCTKAYGKDLPSRARRKVNTGDVVVSSIEGSLQSCAIVTEQYNDALCSTGFYVINSDKINSETLLVLFKSELMQNILKQNCSGTILTAVNKNEFVNIPIPIIDFTKQKQIAELIEESFKLKKESENLLEVAKVAVEVAIEQNETKALQYIVDNTNLV
ncbi:restriction endonuclease subunit S [Tenacibaculum maritimum]|uniref:restriction endonuclease subunit S n=1 Tax=Tenacibaculum maritimum TaxID=107401 RepID=UPI00132F56C4|nr:restriction endonuclease subunit S [Tenacibaculum maritimum]